MKAVILEGGLGTRISEETHLKPKPMIEIGVLEYLKSHPEFKIDKLIQNKLLITVAPDGYLKRIM